MKIHEYQAKNFFLKYNIPHPRGRVAYSQDEACAVAAEFGTFPLVVKAQIHAGGRGKGGGVKVVENLEELKDAVNSIIGMNLVTHQTSSDGQKVKKVLIEEGVNIGKELYLGMLIDRETSSLVIISSEAGGMDIEEISSSSPEKICTESIDPAIGIMPFHMRRIAFALNLPKTCMKPFFSLLKNLYNFFIAEDCSLLEINPLIITADNEGIIALDAKVNFDDNAAFRHKFDELRDLDEEDPLEIAASKYNLNYIKLDGQIGCMVNGAGLAMGTMDIIKICGGEPANFLDVGGGANAEMVENAFRILLSDKNVKAVLINIFGGILRCDTLAQGVVEAAEKTNITLPVVIRLEGTNVERGREILKNSNFNFIVAKSMEEAAKKVVASTK